MMRSIERIRGAQVDSVALISAISLSPFVDCPFGDSRKL